MPKLDNRLSESVEGEIIALYRDSNAPVFEIKETYNLSNGHLYSILRRHGIVRRTKDQRATAPMREEASERLATLDTPADLTVTADANGIVQSVTRVPPLNVKRYTWEVRFEAVIRVQAETIVEAVQDAQRLPMCRRVFGATMKGSQS